MIKINSSCNTLGTDLHFFNSRKFWMVILVILSVYFIIYQLLCPKYIQEGFDVKIGDHVTNAVKTVDLQDFFQFMEHYMVTDMDPRTNPNFSSINTPEHSTTGKLLCNVEGESIRISNNIKNLLTNLYYIIKANRGDNFYHRFLVMKIDPNLESQLKNPVKVFDYDKMVREKVGSQPTFLPSNDFDNYYPKTSVISDNQYPLPNTLSVHNYYTYENMEVNLLAFKKIIELVQYNDHSKFGLLVRPTEHISFEKEFLMPMKSIIYSIIKIIKTDIYKEYIHSQKFKTKYRGIVFNPFMVRL